jgi:DNA mismatch repair protein MutS2
VNGSLEFDLETLTSRYRFRRGVPGASHALDVARRLGFPEALIERARSLTSDESRALERLLAEVGDALAETERERERMALARKAADEAAIEHRDAAEAVKRSLAELRRRLTAESEALLARSRELWQTIQREAKKRDRSRADAEALGASLDGIERGASTLQAAASPAGARASRAARRARGAALAGARGTRARHRPGLRRDCCIGPDSHGNVRLRKGALGITSHVSKLRAPEGEQAKAIKGATVHYESSDAPPPVEDRPARPRGGRGTQRRGPCARSRGAGGPERGAAHPRHRHRGATRRGAEASQDRIPRWSPSAGAKATKAVVA